MQQLKATGDKSFCSQQIKCFKPDLSKKRVPDDFLVIDATSSKISEISNVGSVIKISSEQVAQLTCEKLQWEMKLRQKEHDIRVELLQTKQDYYMAKKNKL